MSTTREAAPAAQALAAIPAGKLIHRMADRFGVDEQKLATTLKQTAFKIPDRECTNEELLTLMVVCDQYGLNPFTREIFAFIGQNGAVIPVVSMDGWNRMANEDKNFNGFELMIPERSEWMTPEGGQLSPPEMTVKIYRKDRDHPILITEYLDEVYRPPYKPRGKDYVVKGPWQSHTKRMLRWKTLIQGYRVAFGFAGIYDEDEANRILEGEAIVVPNRKDNVAMPTEKKLEPPVAAQPERAKSADETRYDELMDASYKGDLSSDQKAELTALIEKIRAARAAAED